MLANWQTYFYLFNLWQTQSAETSCEKENQSRYFALALPSQPNVRNIRMKGENRLMNDFPWLKIVRKFTIKNS